MSHRALKSSYESCYLIKYPYTSFSRMIGPEEGGARTKYLRLRNEAYIPWRNEQRQLFRLPLLQVRCSIIPRCVSRGASHQQVLSFSY